MEKGGRAVMKILHRYTQAVLFEDDSPTMKITLEKAVSKQAYLGGADLGGADLRGADLRGADLSPAIIFNVSWGVVSDALCLEMMRYDAANHPDPKAFDKWAKDPSSGCPYTGTGITRMLWFDENPKLWKSGKAKSAYDLMILLFEERGIKWANP
jgi:hypothetical protein